MIAAASLGGSLVWRNGVTAAVPAPCAGFSAMSQQPMDYAGQTSGLDAGTEVQ